jgi:hypothetical protein
MAHGSTFDEFDRLCVRGKVHDDQPSIDAAADDYERLRSEYLKTVD